MARIIKSKPKIISKKTPSFGPRDLILHPDLNDARRQRIASYKCQNAALKRANNILKDVENQDIPSFRQWFSDSFLKECEQIGSMRQKLEELELLQQATVDYKFLVGGSYCNAYSKVSAAHEAGNLIEMMQDLTKEDEEEIFESDGDEDEFDDIFKSAFREVFGMEEEVLEDERQEAKKSRHASNEQFRNIYRQLARKLHPDFNSDQSAEEKSLWHDLQVAYQGNDMDRLEEIHRRMNGQGSVGIDIWAIALGDLAAMTRNIEMKLQEVNKQIRREKKEDYWDFSRRRKQKGFLSKISSKIRKSMRHESEALEMMIFEIQLALESWRAPRKPAKSNSMKKSPKHRKSPTPKKTKPTDTVKTQKDYWQKHFG